MQSRTKLAKSIRLAMALSAASTITIPNLAYAQSQESDEEVEKIQVTGSRIKRADLEGANPVISLGADQIARSGAINIGDLLNELPALGSTFGLGNSSRFIGTTGLNLLDLRRLGANRTLVLVNGKRHVSGNVGTSSVDVNTIPTEWIERVEVITGGASAVYGADAVTGVVNFILKEDIEGLTGRVQLGYADDSGYDTQLFSISGGSNFADGRGNAAFNLEYSAQSQLGARERSVFSVPNRLVNNPNDGDTPGFNDGIPDEINVQPAGLNFITNGGRFVAGGVPYVFDPDGTVRVQDLGTNFGSGESGFTNDILDLAEVSLLQPEFDRISLNTKFNYDLNDDHQLYFEAKYNRTTSLSFGQPSFDNGGSALQIQRDNPFIDDSLAAIFDDNNLTSISVNRFNVDAGLRGEDVSRETVRGVLGVKGFITENWEYDVYANFGQTDSTQINNNNRVNDRFLASVDAVRDDDGNIVCRVQTDNDLAATNANTFNASDCVATSVFGNGAISQEARDFFNVDSITVNTLNQSNFAAVVSNGSIFELPAGDVGFAAGYEYRKERSNSQPDQLAASGATFLNALQVERGEFDVNEFFVELSAPIIADVPLVKELRIDVAARVADYSTVGNNTAWKVGVDWSVYDDLNLRATASVAIRAPNIGELFGPQNQNFFPVTDPCSVDQFQNGADPAVREANCAALGAPANFDSTTDDATLEGISGGNPDLSEEESDSLTFGAIYSPSFVDGLNIIVDYWSIEIDDAIANVGAQDILNRCVDDQSGIDNQFCALITRDAAFEISNILSITQNVAAFEASGIDFEVNYNFEALAGTWQTRLIGTNLIKNRSFPFQNEPDQTVDARGTLGDPELAANFNISYTTGPFSASWETRFLDRQLLISNEAFRSNPDARDILFAGSTTYHDLQLNYTVNDNLTFNFGVDNVFDKIPPAFLFANGGGSGLFDGIGRFFYAGFNFTL